MTDDDEHAFIVLSAGSTDTEPLFSIRVARGSVMVTRTELYAIGAAAARAVQRQAEFWEAQYRAERSRNRDA